MSKSSHNSPCVKGLWYLLCQLYAGKDHHTSDSYDVSAWRSCEIFVMFEFTVHFREMFYLKA